MKKILLIILILGIAFNAYGSVRNIQDNYEVTYNIIDSNGNHITGETVTVKIKKSSNGYWYDFDDNTFKNSGWTTKSTNLNEDETEGFYYYLFNPPASETSAEEYVFVVDNASATYGDHQSDIVCYQNIGTSILTTSSAVGSVTGSVGSITGVTFPTNFSVLSISASTGLVDITQTGADKVWDAVLTDHLDSGSTGKKLNEMPTPYDVGN